jgi:hypothetical protein
VHSTKQKQGTEACAQLKKKNRYLVVLTLRLAYQVGVRQVTAAASFKAGPSQTAQGVWTVAKGVSTVAAAGIIRCAHDKAGE